MMSYDEFKSCGAVRALLASMGAVQPKPAAAGVGYESSSWLEALESSSNYAAFRKNIVKLNDPNHGHWIRAIRRRAGTASTGEFWLLMGIATLTDFGHIANALTKASIKRRTGPWTGIFASLDEEHAAALAACVYHSAMA